MKKTETPAPSRSAETLSALGSELRRLRDGLKMSVAQAAMISGLAEEYITALEAGAVKFPAPFALHALANTYTASYHKLMELAGHLIPKPTLQGRLRALTP